MTTVTVSPRFQVVIPLAVRQRLNLRPGAKLQVIDFKGGLWLMPPLPPSALRGIARNIDTTIQHDPDRSRSAVPSGSSTA
jgi:AbrB family looped-hinge helix DNA binding protein